MHKFPLLQLKQFKNPNGSGRIYTNDLKTHLSEHDFITKAHRHNFYLLVIFTHGSGNHEIDFQTYPVLPGTVFVLRPGQVHQWSLSKDIEGYILFHTSDYFNITFNGFEMDDFPLFKPGLHNRVFHLDPMERNLVLRFFQEIHSEYYGLEELRFRKICSLINLIYIELSRTIETVLVKEKSGSRAYSETLKKFEKLIESNFRTKKMAKEYADLLNISSRHLNRVCQSGFGKTPTDLILDRIVLEARRLMVHRSKNIGEISSELGYEDPAYFSRVFKNRIGETPTGFMKKYKDN